MSVQIIRGDARQLPLADESVDLIVTSPPYFALRSYQDGGQHYAGQIGAEPTPAEYVAALLECTREWMRVLKPSGSLWVNLGDKYSTRAGQFGPQGATGQRATRAQAATFTDAPARRPDMVYGVRPKSLIGLPWRYALACVDDLGLILRAEVIWSKPNAMPESVTDRVRRSHERMTSPQTRPGSSGRALPGAKATDPEPGQPGSVATNLSRRKGGTEFSLTGVTDQEIALVTQAARRYVTDETELADVLDMLLGEAGRFSERNPNGYMKARYGTCPYCRRRTELLVGKPELRNHPYGKKAGSPRCDGSLRLPLESEVAS